MTINDNSFKPGVGESYGAFQSRITNLQAMMDVKKAQAKAERAARVQIRLDKEEDARQARTKHTGPVGMKSGGGNGKAVTDQNGKKAKKQQAKQAAKKRSGRKS